MPANVAIRRAGVHTGPAADAAQHIAKLRAQHLRATVIDNHQVELFRSVHVIRLTRAGQPGVIARQTSAHGAARQHGDQHIHIGKGWRDTLHAHHRNVRFRQRGAHARVAFVGHQAY